MLHARWNLGSKKTLPPVGSWTYNCPWRHGSIKVHLGFSKNKPNATERVVSRRRRCLVEEEWRLGEESSDADVWANHSRSPSQKTGAICCIKDKRGFWFVLQFRAAQKPKHGQKWWLGRFIYGQRRQHWQNKRDVGVQPSLRPSC